MLSTIEKIIFLKQVPMFQEMTLDHLKVLAHICEEASFAPGQTICQEGEPGGVLYIIIWGRVAIERTGRRKGTTTRIATLEANSSIGEMTLFDKAPRTASVVTLQETLTVCLRREPLLALARQYPEMLLALIHTLSTRLAKTTSQIAQFTRSQPRELHKLFDDLEKE